MVSKINGRTYDTSSAFLIGGDESTDISTSLYRKTTGEYFLYVESPYYTSQIKPVTDADAKSWVEQHMGKDIADKLFTVNTGETRRKSLRLELDPVLYDYLNKAARSEGKSTVKYIREAIILRLRQSGAIGVDELS